MSKLMREIGMIMPYTYEVGGEAVLYLDGRVTEKLIVNHYVNTDGGSVSETHKVTMGYDSNNNLIEQLVDPDGLNLKNTMRYNAAGQLIATVGANGYAVQTSNDDWAVKHREDLGLVYQAGDSRIGTVVDGHTVAEGDVIFASQLTDPEKQTIADGFTSRQYYDTTGRLILSVAPNGIATAYNYNAQGQVTYTKLHTDTVVNATDYGYSLTNDIFRQERFDYDAVGRQIGSSSVDEVRVYDVSLDENGLVKPADDGVLQAITTGIGYSDLGQVQYEEDASGYRTYYYHDALGRVIGMIDAAGYVTRYELDAFGNIKKAHTFLDAHASDNASREARLADFATYDFGSDARVKTVEYDYDLMGNQTAILTEGMSIYEIDEATGNGVIESNVQTQILKTYDAFGQLVKETEAHKTTELTPAVVAYEYDSAGRMTRSVTPIDGLKEKVVELVYDQLGQVIKQVESERLVADGSIVSSRTTEMVYDKAGRVSQQILPAFDVTENDNAGADGYSATNYRPEMVFTYDAEGHQIIREQSNGVDGVNGFDNARTYHHFDRLGREVLTIDRHGQVSQFTYNQADQVTVEYKYENLVDEATAKRGGKPAVDSAYDQKTERIYDTQGNVIEEIRYGAGTYDDRHSYFSLNARGQVTRTADARGYESFMLYDARGINTGSVNANGYLTTHEVDAFGNQVGTNIGEKLLSDDKRISSLSTQVRTGTDTIEFLTPSHSDISSVKVFYRLKGSTGSYTEVTQTRVDGGQIWKIVDGLEQGTEFEYYLEYKLEAIGTVTSEIETVATDPRYIAYSISGSNLTNTHEVTGTEAQRMLDAGHRYHELDMSFVLAEIDSSSSFHDRTFDNVRIKVQSIDTSYEYFSATYNAVTGRNEAHVSFIGIEHSTSGLRSNYSIEWTNDDGETIVGGKGYFGWVDSREESSYSHTEFHWKEEYYTDEFQEYPDYLTQMTTGTNPSNPVEPPPNSWEWPAYGYGWELEYQTDVEVNTIYSAPHLDMTVSTTADVTEMNSNLVALSSNSEAKVFNVYDEHGRAIYTNQNNGVWTRNFYDEQGQVVRSVQFRWSDDEGTFLDVAPTFDEAPERSTLDAKYEAAMVAWNASSDASPADTVRQKHYYYNTAGQLVKEQVIAKSFIGGSYTQDSVYNLYEYDAWGNRTEERYNLKLRNDGSLIGIDGQENTTRYTFDAYESSDLKASGLHH